MDSPQDGKQNEHQEECNLGDYPVGWHERENGVSHRFAPDTRRLRESITPPFPGTGKE